ncbi:MAG: NAD(P)/FAD-dependent oxidoreductase [Oscillospiraceae bacterium]|jgi:phytoene dehydrogenase-like protein|nr:NAD(P)/FAD-dependent oxidoreductase [Oscillospiraceae bacterium]
MSKKVIIIGAGIAGLSAGIYAKRSGFDVTLIEQHSIVGGTCTSWKRKGYLFEGAVHWLTGSSPAVTGYHQLWKETGALGDGVTVHTYEPFRSVEWDGQVISIVRDIDKTAESLRKISPQDAPLIDRLVKDVKKVSKMPFPVTDIKGVKCENPQRMRLGMLFKMLPVLPVMGKYGKMSCGQFAKQFTHPGLQRLFGDMPGHYSAMALLMTYVTLNVGDGGYPEGGSLAMVHRMSKTFTDLGGKLMLNTKVQKVNIRAGKATGVILENQTLDADAVIVTQETVAALDKLFDTPPQDAWLKEIQETAQSAVCTFVSIGVRAELPDITLPEWKLDTPITYAGQTDQYISFNSYRRHAPEGGTALTTVFLTDTYDFWKKAKDEGRYEQEKEALAKQVSRALCQKYPQCEGKIEVIDIATPLTYERYTGAYHGSWMGEMRVGDKRKQYPGTCESVSGLYFAGHRLIPPGGSPVALQSGRTAAQLVCRQFDKIFR